MSCIVNGLEVGRNTYAPQRGAAPLGECALHHDDHFTPHARWKVTLPVHSLRYYLPFLNQQFLVGTG